MCLCADRRLLATAALLRHLGSLPEAELQAYQRGAAAAIVNFCDFVTAACSDTGQLALRGTAIRLGTNPEVLLQGLPTNVSWLRVDIPMAAMEAGIN